MLWRKEARWWVIGTVSQQLLDEGHIPGGVWIAVAPSARANSNVKISSECGDRPSSHRKPA